MDLNIYHLHTHSALHCGTGQSAGIVALPIARDKATHLPIVPGSSLRGVLRDKIRANEKDIEKALFGPRDIQSSEQSFAGALSLGDANLLVLPIRSLNGIVAYATCPFVLRNYANDTKISVKETPLPQPSAQQALVSNENVNVIQHDNHTELLVLEDLDISAEKDEKVQAWAKKIAEAVYSEQSDLKDEFINRFVVLSDNVFSYLSTTATELRTRIRITEKTGVVKEGALWSEENLPANAILWGVYSLSDSRDKKQELTAPELKEKLSASYTLQMGGNAGIGRGLVSLFTKKEEKETGGQE